MIASFDPSVRKLGKTIMKRAGALRLPSAQTSAAMMSVAGLDSHIYRMAIVTHKHTHVYISAHRYTYYMTGAHIALT